MEKIIVYAGVAVTVLIAVAVLGMILAWPTMMLWNGCLVPAVTGVHEIEWLQAWGINILFGMLFKSNISK